MGLIVKNSIKEATDLQIAEEVYAEMDKKVAEILKKAEHRAKANGRRTLFARDL